MTDELYLSIGGRKVSGWTDVRLTRGIERCPSDFEVGITETYPGDVGTLVVSAGDACQISLGADLVLTGYVDRYVPSYTAGDHSIRVSGRGKCMDLVDCSAVWPKGQINGTSAVDIAQKLAGYYGITVDCAVSGLPVIPQFNVFIGETPFEIIERVSRYSQLLVYDRPDGNLQLAQATQQVTATGGVIEGTNVQAASVVYSAEERFSEYVAFAQSVAIYGDIGVGLSALGRATDAYARAPRERYIVAEAVQGYSDLAQRRAQWEANRRAGRAVQVSATVDSWRDSGGTLWTPNTLVTVSLPTLHLVQTQMLIGEVTYSRSLEGGTTAQLMMMYPAAFLPEPIVLLPMFVDGSTRS